MELKVKKLNDAARLPTRATEYSAGYDIYALLAQPLTIKAGERVMVPTGLIIACPVPECAAFIFARSGLAVKHGITLSNGVGVVDSDYRGELKIGLVNLGSTDYTIEPHERIAQLVLLPVMFADIVQCSELDDTQRGKGGFGSSGRL